MKKLLPALSLLLACSGYAQQTDSIPADTLRPDDKPAFHAAPGKWAAGVEYGYGMSFRKINAEGNDGLLSCRTAHEKAAGSNNLSLKLRYALNERLELISGLSWYQTGFSFAEGKQLNDTLEHEFVLGCETGFIIDGERGFIGIGFYDPRYVTTIHGLHPSSGTMHVELKYNYVEVPLLLRAHLGKKRVRGYAAAGGDVNYLAGVTQRTYFTNGDITFGEYTTREVYPMYKRWNLGAQVALGVECMISNSLSAGFHVSGKYHLQSIFCKYSDVYKENHFAGWAGIELFYHFGKSHS